jgi:hypothetical protein
MITIINEFHKSEVRVRANIGDVLTARQVRRIRRTLCGRIGCTCGGILSERGHQPVPFDGQPGLVSGTVALLELED